jgi:deoxyribodipyrimidine photo-lyase
MVPPIRITAVNYAPVRRGGDYVLYWMIAARRAHWNFGLQRAVEQAGVLGKPLVVFEALRADHRWAALRFHQFVVDGMQDNAAAFQAAGIRYYPYVEPTPGEARGLLRALAARAAVVVTDDFPCFFLPRMVGAARRARGRRLERAAADARHDHGLPNRIWFPPAAADGVAAASRRSAGGGAVAAPAALTESATSG